MTATADLTSMRGATSAPRGRAAAVFAALVALIVLSLQPVCDVYASSHPATGDVHTAQHVDHGSSPDHQEFPCCDTLATAVIAGPDLADFVATHGDATGSATQAGPHRVVRPLLRVASPGDVSRSIPYYRRSLRILR